VIFVIKILQQFFSKSSITNDIVKFCDGCSGDLLHLCKYIYKNGERKDERCSRQCNKSREYCFQHANQLRNQRFRIQDIKNTITWP